MNTKQELSWLKKHQIKILIGVAFLVAGAGMTYLKESGRLAGVNSRAYSLQYSSAYPDLSRYDVNADGKADFSDPKHISQFVAGLTTTCPIRQCDISFDGQITSYDASLLAQALERIYDVNIDGKFTKDDPIYISQSVVGTVRPCAVSRCDLSRDGKVTSYDASLLAQRFATKEQVVTEEPYPDLSKLDFNQDGTADFRDSKDLAKKLELQYDTNGDGLFTANDPKYISEFVAGIRTSCPLAKCDLSRDGKVSSYDASLLSQRLLTK